MNYILFLFIALTTIILLVGLLSMAGGEKFSKKFGVKLMTLRIVFQGIAIFAIAIIYFMNADK